MNFSVHKFYILAIRRLLCIKITSYYHISAAYINKKALVFLLELFMNF